MKRNKILAVLFFASSMTFALTQEELLEKLHQNNADIIKAESDYMQACLDLKDAKGGLGPTIDMQISGTYMVNPPIGEVSVGAEELVSLLSVNGYTIPFTMPVQDNNSVVLYEGMEHTLYQFQLNLTQPVFTWGKLTNAIKLYEEVAGIRLNQKNDLIRKKEIELLTRETALHFILQIEKILDEESNYTKRLVEISQAYEKNGLLLKQDVLNARMQAQEVDVAKKKVQREKEIQIIEIQKLLSEEIDLSEISFIPDEKKLSRFLSLTRSNVEEAAIDQENSQMKILSALVETATLAKKIADASVYWKPDIALQSSIGYTGQRFPWIQEDWNDYGKYSLNFSLGIRTTVWDGGKAIRNVKRKEDDLNKARSQYEDSVTQIKLAAATAYSDMTLAESKWQYQKLLIENDDMNLKRHESEYKAGYGSEIDLLKAKIQKLTDTITSYQLETDMYVNCLTLDYLTGGRL